MTVGLDADTVAAYLGWPESRLVEYENGDVRPRPKTISQILFVESLSIEQIYDRLMGVADDAA